MAVVIRDLEPELQQQIELEDVGKRNKLVAVTLRSKGLTAQLEVFMGDGEARLSDYLREALERRVRRSWRSPERELIVRARLEGPGPIAGMMGGVRIEFVLSAGEVRSLENWECEMSVLVSKTQLRELVAELADLENKIL